MRCNKVLGLIKDDSQLLLAMQQYLFKWRKNGGNKESA